MCVKPLPVKGARKDGMGFKEVGNFFFSFLRETEPLVWILCVQYIYPVNPPSTNCHFFWGRFNYKLSFLTVFVTTQITSFKELVHIISVTKHLCAAPSLTSF